MPRAYPKIGPVLPDGDPRLDTMTAWGQSMYAGSREAVFAAERAAEDFAVDEDATDPKPVLDAIGLAGQFLGDVIADEGDVDIEHPLQGLYGYFSHVSRKAVLILDRIDPDEPASLQQVKAAVLRDMPVDPINMIA